MLLFQIMSWRRPNRGKRIPKEIKKLQEELAWVQKQISQIRQENFLDLSMLDSFVANERGKLLQELYAKEKSIKQKL